MSKIPAHAFAILLSSYVMSQFYRSFLAVLTPSLSVDLGMSNNQMSQALGAWFVAFAVAQFLVGPLLDNIGPRKTAGIIHLIFAGGGAALFAMAFSPWMVIGGMALIGIGCAPVLMATLFVFRKTFSPARLAVLVSTFIAIGSAGNLLGTSPLAFLVELYGWREVMWLLCGASVAIGFLILLFVPRSLRSSGTETRKGSYREILTIRELWPIFPIMAISFAGVTNIRGLWAGPYFKDVHGLATTEIGMITFWMAVAMIVGTVVYGPLDTIFNSRKWVVSVGVAILVVITMIWAINPAMESANVTWLMIAMGAAGTSYAVVMAHGMAFVPDHLTGRGATMLNFFAIGGSGFMQVISGYVYDWAYDPSDLLTGYGAILWLYVLTTFASLVYYLTSKDAKPGKVADVSRRAD